MTPCTAPSNVGKEVPITMITSRPTAGFSKRSYGTNDLMWTLRNQRKHPHSLIRNTTRGKPNTCENDGDAREFMT